MRSVSANCSEVSARPNRRSEASTSAMMSPSKSSRSSTVPSSLASSAGSSDSAAARFSASGVSPSYMNAPV